MSDNITDIVLSEQQIHEIAEKSKPINLMEDSLVDFVKDTFQMAKEEDEYQKKIKDAIINALPDMKPAELIALVTSAATNKNDMISKLISPMMQLLTAKQQHEIAQLQKEQSPQYQQTNIAALNNGISSDILSGMRALEVLATALGKQVE